MESTVEMPERRRRYDARIDELYDVVKWVVESQKRLESSNSEITNQIYDMKINMALLLEDKACRIREKSERIEQDKEKDRLKWTVRGVWIATASSFIIFFLQYLPKILCIISKV